jgi:hypothetical protein
VPPHTHGTPAQEEGRSTGHADHPPVEPPTSVVDGPAGDHRHVERTDWNGILVVLDDVAVDDHEGNGGVSAIAERQPAPVMAGHVRPEAIAKVVSKFDHGRIIPRGRDGSRIAA